MNARFMPAGRERSTLPREPQTAIRAGEVHVWHGTLDARPEPVTPAEEARARRMRSAGRRREFLVARGALRRILAGALGLEPLAVPIREGAHGKPRLVPRSAGLPPIRFNLSHSGDRFIAALALGMDPGVDVELIRPRRSLDLLARHCFSPAEQRAVTGDPDPMHAFYRVWARKEAVIKAHGRGVSLGLDRFDVSAGETAALLRRPLGGSGPGPKRRAGPCTPSRRPPATRPPSPSAVRTRPWSSGRRPSGAAKIRPGQSVRSPAVPLPCNY